MLKIVVFWFQNYRENVTLSKLDPLCFFNRNLDFKRTYPGENEDLNSRASIIELDQGVRYDSLCRNEQALPYTIIQIFFAISSQQINIFTPKLVCRNSSPFSPYC